MFHRWILTLLMAAIGCSITFAETFTVTVKAVDADKKPVAKADVADFWDVKNGVMTPISDYAVVTDGKGKAVVRSETRSAKRMALVLSADRKLGGIIGVNQADEGKGVIVTLGKTVRVKGKLVCKELNSKPEWANTTVNADGFPTYFAQNISRSAAFKFVLPAGKYRWAVMARMSKT
jgi:hypothetical protein